MPLELGNINLGQLVQAATMPPAIQFMQGLAQLPDTFAKAEYDAGQAQKSRLDAQSLKMQIAKNQWDQTVSMIQKNPDLAHSQAVIHKMQSLTGDTGYTLPMDGTGAIDSSVWGADFNEFMKDKDFQERWWAATPTARRAMASAMHMKGISEEAYDAEPVLTSAESSMAERVSSFAAYNADRIKNNDLLIPTIANLNNAKSYAARKNADTNAQNAITKRRDVDQKMAMLKYRVDAMEAIASKKNKTAYDIAQYHEYARELIQNQTNASTAVNDLEKVLGTAWGADVDADTMKPLVDALKTYQENLTQAGTRAQTLNNTFDASVNDSHGRAVSGQANKQATVQNAAPPQGRLERGWLAPGVAGWRDSNGRLYRLDGSPYP